MIRLIVTIFALLGFAGMAFATHDGIPGDNKGWATETETTSTQGSSGKPAKDNGNEGTTDTTTTTSSPPGNTDNQHSQSDSETSGPGKGNKK